jgi:UPF0755 protein
MSGLSRKVFGTLAGLAFVVATIAVIGLRDLGTRPLGSAGKVPQIVEVEKGLRPRSLVTKLSELGLTDWPELLYWYGRFKGSWGQVKAGEYEVKGELTADQFFATIASGVSVQKPVLLREGENIYQFADTLVVEKRVASKEEVIKYLKDPEVMKGFGFTDPLPESLEGYLSPNTYFFPRSEKLSVIVAAMVKESDKFWGKAEADRAAVLGLTRAQVVTLASMIEKETSVTNERALISGVFHNRLRKKMRLQSDPTTIYGIWERYNGNITKADLLEETPYNTYRIPALPAGPISNPHPETIQAALYPAETPAIFFVSRNDGTHRFSETLDEHNQAVKTFQLDPGQREGKSWRNLPKTR